MDLDGAVLMWPTPQSHDVTARGNTEADHHHYPHDLSNAAAMWPTPDAAVMNDGQSPEAWAARHEREKAKGYNGNGGGTPLAEAASMWQTPSRADLTGGHATRGGDRNGELLLVGQARAGMWLTPSANEDAAGTVDGKMQQMLTQAKRFPSSLPGPESENDGLPSSASDPTSRRRLNPAFVEWLMGWPPGWTDLASPFSATALSLWQRHMRFSLSLLGWEVA